MTIQAIPHDPMLAQRTARCRCMECGQYFNSPGAFTRHRVGGWDNRGLGRRCLTSEEMSSRGWVKLNTGHWARALMHTRPATENRQADKPAQP